MLLAGGAGAAGATAGPTGSNARARPARVVSYQFRAEFGLGLDVRWTSEEGSRASCSWTHREGTWEVDAGSVGKLPGSILTYPKWTKGQGWALLSAVGKAHAEVKRTLVQQGSVPTSSGACQAETFPPTDCGRHEYTTRAATLTATWRGNVETLEGRTRTPEVGLAPAIAVSVPPLRPLYRSCELGPFVPPPAGIPGDIGFLVDPRKLEALKPGQTYTYDSRKNKTSSGPCTKKLPEGATCTFTLDLHVDIRR
ncbi:MAG: hypothetical protein C5B48_03515, partial [Candidatus Rokuibacteriota bacterium]